MLLQHLKLHIPKDVLQELQERFDLKMKNFEFKEISEKDLENFED